MGSIGQESQDMISMIRSMNTFLSSLLMGTNDLVQRVVSQTFQRTVPRLLLFRQTGSPTPNVCYFESLTSVLVNSANFFLAAKKIKLHRNIIFVDGIALGNRFILFVIIYRQCIHRQNNESVHHMLSNPSCSCYFSVANLCLFQPVFIMA